MADDPPSPRPSHFVGRLPFGQRLQLGDLVGEEMFPFDGEISVKPLQPPILPEPLRRGEPGGEPCPACSGDGEHVAWEDERWSVVIGTEPHGLPMVAVLRPKAHHDLEDLPLELAAELGRLIQRVVLAVQRIDGIGRVHVNRWGDGSAHLHVWFLARPEGMRQLRGAMLAVWDDLLPRVPQEEWNRNRQEVAAALAEGGGVSLA